MAAAAFEAPRCWVAELKKWAGGDPEARARRDPAGHPCCDLIDSSFTLVTMHRQECVFTLRSRDIPESPSSELSQEGIGRFCGL